ncbi:uncharacterized protein TNCV_3163811 [Trichonephila clavipes]|nr:uncharacterized protein TNCV_3163811 [Trichonephila clavipes]
MTHRKDPSSDEITNLSQYLFENEMDGGKLSCSNLDSNKYILLRESDCEESEERADVIDNIPVNPDIFVAGDSPDSIQHNSNIPGRFVTRNVLRQSNGLTSFARHIVNVSSFMI